MSEYIIDAGPGEWDSCITDQTYESDIYYGVCVGKITRCKDCESFHKTLRYRKCWPEIGKCSDFVGRRPHYVRNDDFCSGAEPKEGAE
jgi:hypothetical protein